MFTAAFLAATLRRGIFVWIIREEPALSRCALYTYCMDAF